MERLPPFVRQFLYLKMASKQPIGFFDSGVGGTSIWKEVHKVLPNENTIYLADSKNAPYGPKGKKKILDLAHKNTQLLLDMGCKLIVVACNTATTNAIHELRETYPIPFIGIEPAIKPAALQTKTGVVGMLATEGTLSSTLFHETSNLFASNIAIIEQIGNGLVELIEAGKLHSEEMRSLLEEYLRPMIDAQVDHIVLGCSHYPYLIPAMQRILPEGIKIIDSGEAVARQTRSILQKNDLLNTSEEKSDHTFYSNASTTTLNMLLDKAYKVSFLDF